MILHAHFLLHLYLISIFSDYLSLINTKSIIERDNLERSKKETEEETVWQRLKKNIRIPRLDYPDRDLLRIGFITCVSRL